MAFFEPLTFDRSLKMLEDQISGEKPFLRANTKTRPKGWSGRKIYHSTAAERRAEAQHQKAVTELKELLYVDSSSDSIALPNAKSAKRLSSNHSQTSTVQGKGVSKTAQAAARTLPPRTAKLDTTHSATSTQGMEKRPVAKKRVDPPRSEPKKPSKIQQKSQQKATAREEINIPVGAEGYMNFLASDLKDPIKQTFEQAIQNAKRTITLIAFSVTSKEICNALKSAAERGVKVHVIHDATQQAPDLGSKVVVHPVSREDSEYKMHHKLLSIDRKYSWIGSGNFVSSAFTSQGNLFVHFTCRSIAERIERLAQVYIKNAASPRNPLNITLGQTSITMFSNIQQGQKARQEILERISTATKRIFVAMFTCTDKRLLRALCQAKDSGVDVRVVLDKQIMKSTNTTAFSLLHKHGITCRWREKGLLHYKTALIDDTLIHGSLNWTTAGSTENDETCFVMNPIPSAWLGRLDEWWRIVETL